MSERLTDEELNELESLTRGRLGRSRRDVSLLTDDAARMLTELRERRAADLTDEDLKALRELRGLIIGNNPSDVTPRMRVALAVLDRLLHGGK
jgi:hypothetical protein